MKKQWLTLLLIAAAIAVQAQSTDENFIRTRTFIKNGNQHVETIQYFDGLGRPTQSIGVGATPGGNDFVSQTEYNELGLEYRQWLPVPVAGNDGSYIDAEQLKALTNSYSAYTEGHPYTETIYESSPMNRPVGQKTPGTAWHNRPSKITNGTNTYDEVRNFEVNSVGKLVLRYRHPANTLYKTTTTDEDGKQVSEYKNKLGQTIMRRESNNNDTYFVYNKNGELCYVLPPMAMDEINNSTQIPTAGYSDYDNNGFLRKYAYLYRYDSRGRNIVKRLPGCDSICMVYDKADRLIMSQDGNQKDKGLWLITKYDHLGRPIYSGEITNPSNQAFLATYFADRLMVEELRVNDQSVYSKNTGYMENYYYNRIRQWYTVNYYDDYRFFKKIPAGIDTTQLAFDAAKTEYGTRHNAKGLLTGTRTYLLDGSGQFITTVYYYDYRGNIIQTRSTNQLGGYDIVFNRYDYTGQVIKTEKTHTAPGKAKQTELYEHAYDHANRPTTTYYQINTRPRILLSALQYDELGRMHIKMRHNNYATQTEEYAYNIRNWPVRIKSGNFQEELFYNSNLPAGALACYNGNIAATSWTYNDKNYTTTYSYDHLNRLTFAGGGNCGGNMEYFSYDRNGNIKTLQRFRGYSPIDMLTISYTGNQVLSVTDQFRSQGLYSVKEYHDKSTGYSEFAYDKNGNMIKDQDREIVTIRYNSLNLPDTVQFANGNQIVNRYAADGRKLATNYFTRVIDLTVPLTAGQTIKLSYIPGVVDLRSETFIGNIDYTTHSYYIPGYGNSTSNTYRIKNAEGYFASPNYFYYHRDHLGNTREVTAGGKTAVTQRTQYYASGLPWSEGMGAKEQPYKYNGKEFIEMNDYDILDYGARGMYPALMCFTTIDPLAEKYYSISPYAYCANNPIRFIDPDGRDIIISWEEDDETKTMKYSYDRNRKLNNNAPEFLKNTLQALDNLYENKALTITFGQGENATEVDIMGKFMESDQHNLTIVEGTEINEFNPQTNTISFLSNDGGKFRKDLSEGWNEENTGRNSASALLAHEIVHGYNKEFNYLGYLRNKKMKLDKDNAPYFPNMEEQRVTLNYGNQINKNLKEDIRSHYELNHYKTKNPTSTQ